MKKIFFALVCYMTISLPSYALDRVETLDGGILTGTIKSITETTIILLTSYAGELTLKRSQINGLATDQTLVIRLKDDTTLKGKVHHEGYGQLVIIDQGISVTTEITSIIESWQPKDHDPQLVRAEQALYALEPKWSYEAALDIVGKKGNSEQLGISGLLTATRESTADTLKFYTSLERETKNKVNTANEFIFGSEYTAYYADPWGWYIRGEGERDDFENLELRIVLAAGLNYRIFHEKTHSLELRSGLGYRYENFNDGTSENSPTLDFGVAHKWQFVDWAKMTNHLTYTPAINDFTDYLLTHDSGITIPIGFSNLWNLRFGLRNDYKSMPASGREKIDTSYYSRIQLKW